MATEQFGDIGMESMGPESDAEMAPMDSGAAPGADPAADVAAQLDAMDPLAIVDYLKTKGILDKDFEMKLPDAEDDVGEMPAAPDAGFGGIDLSALTAAPPAA